MLHCKIIKCLHDIDISFNVLIFLSIVYRNVTVRILHKIMCIALIDTVGFFLG